LLLTTSTLACASRPPSAAIAPAVSAARSPLGAGDHVERLNGVRLAYHVAGNGPVVILPTPGWGPDSALYATTMTRLEASFSMVYVDTRGSGGSEPKDLGESYRFGVFADDLDALRVFLGRPRVLVIGHSMGGMIAVDYCGRYADRCAALVVIDSSPSIDDAAFAAAGDASLAEVKSAAWYPAVAAAREKFTIRKPSDQHFKELLDRIWPLYFYDQDKLAQLRGRLDPARYSSFAFNMVFGHPLPQLTEAAIRQVSAPTLIVEGLGDLVVPRSQAERFGAVQHPELLLVPRAGHFPWLEAPEPPFFSGVEAFLRRHAGRTLGLAGRPAPGRRGD
jgi:proline iminopeptidase